MNEERFVVSDMLWRQLEPHLPGKISDAGATAKDNRLFLEAVLWRMRTGSPWRDLPPAFGRWNSPFRQFRRQTKAGIFESLFKDMSNDPDLEYASSTALSFRSIRRRPAQKGDPASSHWALARRIDDQDCGAC